MKASLFIAPHLLVSCADASQGPAAEWLFGQTEGPVVDTAKVERRDDRTDNRPSNGWVGYSPGSSDDSQVQRDGTSATFNGHRDSIILIDQANHADFNPGDEAILVTMRFTIDRSALIDEALAPKETWNLVQKGRFNNAGGQWKLQVLKNHSRKLFFQCLANDDNPETSREYAQIPIRPATIMSDQILEGRCAFDRALGEIRAELEGIAPGSTTSRARTALPDDFGSVAPQTGDCSSPNAYGGNVAIGNKPLCPDQPLDTNDAFRGRAYQVRIDRF